MDYQDMLASLGADSAHPGGMKSTWGWMRQIRIQGRAQVLEVGCGTARTLNELATRCGCRCSGIDVRPEMIEKATHRSEAAGNAISLQVADVQRLPFADASFDLVLAESVNVFLPDVSAGLAECYRVLRPGGIYLDVEMTLMSPVSPQWKQEVGRVYGVKVIPDTRGWKRYLQQAGFDSVKVLHSQGIQSQDMMQKGMDESDALNLASPGAYQNPEILQLLGQNAQWLENNHRYMGFVVLAARKGPGNNPLVQLTHTGRETE